MPHSFPIMSHSCIFTAHPTLRKTSLHRLLTHCISNMSHTSCQHDPSLANVSHPPSPICPRAQPSLCLFNTHNPSITNTSHPTLPTCSTRAYTITLLPPQCMPPSLPDNHHLPPQHVQHFSPNMPYSSTQHVVPSLPNVYHPSLLAPLSLLNI